MVKAISILGCTGSIGRQSIAVAEHLDMPVVALTANRQVELTERQARRLKPKFVALNDENAAKLTHKTAPSAMESTRALTASTVVFSMENPAAW